MSQPTAREGPTAFSWFPGHMRSAWRQLQQDLKLADAVVFVADARAPGATRHPELEASLTRHGKPLLLVLNKSDLADPAQTRRWVAHLEKEGTPVVAISAQQGQGAGPLRAPLERLRHKLTERRAEKGIFERDARLAVAGLPNVGKSSLLNRLVGRGAAKTGKKAGLTRGKGQWVAGPDGWQVLDSPGITYPRIDRQRQLVLLAGVGCLKADVLPLEEVTEDLLALLGREPVPDSTRLEALAREKGFLLSGARPDLERAARWVLAGSLDGRWGPITLEPCL